jgi:hypothetical protein
VPYEAALKSTAHRICTDLAELKKATVAEASSDS